MHPMPAMTNESTIAGPANWAAAVPVNTKMPAPIIAPIPRVIKFTGPSARFSECSLVSAASAMIVLIGFVDKSLLTIHSLRFDCGADVLLTPPLCLGYVTPPFKAAIERLWWRAEPILVSLPGDIRYIPYYSFFRL